jgi:hypothetical protein
MLHDVGYSAIRITSHILLNYEKKATGLLQHVYTKYRCYLT